MYVMYRHFNHSSGYCICVYSIYIYLSTVCVYVALLTSMCYNNYGLFLFGEEFTDNLMCSDPHTPSNKLNKWLS